MPQVKALQLMLCTIRNRDVRRAHMCVDQRTDSVCLRLRHEPIPILHTCRAPRQLPINASSKLRMRAAPQDVSYGTIDVSG